MHLNKEETVRPPSPRRLVLALIGELHRDGLLGPYRAVDIIEVLQSTGVSAASIRAALDRFVVRGLLSRDRDGRSMAYKLTDAGVQVITAGGERVHATTPFEPCKSGWTLVTFSIPEGKRGLRHRLRAALTWAGFAPLRDGVWVAAGERDLTHLFEALSSGVEVADIVAFRAQDLTAFPMDERVGSAWDLESIRAAHEDFLSRWDATQHWQQPMGALAVMTMLVADWLVLLRKDPSLPARYLGDDWPSQRSHAAYLESRARFGTQAAAECDLFGERAKPSEWLQPA